MQYVADITLDVACPPTFKVIRAKQGDDASRYVNITVAEAGNVVTVPSSATVQFRAGKPDGAGIYNPATVNSDGTVTVELTAQTLAVAGRVLADIVILQGGAVLATASWTIIVEENPLGNVDIESESEWLVLQGFVDEATTQATNAAASATAAASSATAASASAAAAAESEDTAREYADNIADPVSGLVTTWLEENVDPSTGYVLDKTLTVEGAAADAKAAGDAISAVEQLALAAYATDTASGSIASFTDGADDVPVKSISIAVAPSQAGGGDPSPENVRPITGWTGATVVRCGRNLLPINLTDGTYAGITFTAVIDADGQKTGIQMTGTSTSSVSAAYRTIAATALPPGQYILGKTGIANVMIRIGENGTTAQSSGVFLAQATETEDATFDVEAGVVYNFSVGVLKNATVNNVVAAPMLRLSSDTDANFVPYQGTTYAIAFPSSASAVYGGTLDVTNGVLTVEYGLQTITGGAAKSSDTVYRCYSAAIADGDFSNDPYVISNYLPKSSGAVSGVATFRQSAGTGNRNIYIYNPQVLDASITDAASMNAYLAAHPLQVCCRLATPTTYQLTPTEVQTLLGANNIWADCGEVSVTYRADTSLFINKKLGE